MQAFTNTTRLNLNQIIIQRWSVREAIDDCVRAGIPFIGLWREKVAERDETLAQVIRRYLEYV